MKPEILMALLMLFGSLCIFIYLSFGGRILFSIRRTLYVKIMPLYPESSESSLCYIEYSFFSKPFVTDARRLMYFDEGEKIEEVRNIWMAWRPVLFMLEDAKKFTEDLTWQKIKEHNRKEEEKEEKAKKELENRQKAVSEKIIKN